MSIKVHLYSNLQKYCDNRPVVEVAGQNVGECLNDLVNKYPALKNILFDKSRTLLANVYVSINLNSASSEKLENTIEEGDQLYIILIVAGG